MRRALVFLCLLACSKRADERAPSAASPPPLLAAPPPAAFSARVEDVPIEGDLTAFVVRGREHRLKMLFIPGMCVHPGGYIMAFQHTAAARGDLVSVQGD